MAETRLSDIIVPSVFTRYGIERSVETNAFVQSGVIQRDQEFDRLADGEGKAIDMPYWKDLTGNSEVTSDTTPATLEKITTGQDRACIHNRHKAWGHNDLVGMLAGSDPAMAVKNLVGGFWSRDMTTILLACLAGIFADASMSANLLELHATSGSVDADDNTLNGLTFPDAVQLFGDNRDKLTAVAMHSAVRTFLEKRNLIDFVPDSTLGELEFFQGKRVLVDDRLVPTVVNSANAYPTYLFGQGAFGLGFGARTMAQVQDGMIGTEAVEFVRDALAHVSGMINRRRFILHPRGVKYTGDVQALQSGPTNAELADDDNWLRVFNARHVRIVKVISNIV